MKMFTDEYKEVMLTEAEVMDMLIKAYGDSMKGYKLDNILLDFRQDESGWVFRLKKEVKTNDAKQ